MLAFSWVFLMRINLPSKNPDGLAVTIDSPCRIVVIGANGSGKTRFGVWLEVNNQEHMAVHRVSAQKALTIPEYAPVKNLEQAENDLFLGRADEHANLARKADARWGGNLATHMLSDYEKLLALLFAKHAKRNELHTEEAKKTGLYAPVQNSPIELIIKIWGYLMPHRTISFGDGKVIVGKGTPTAYHAKEMSDGERVTLYLLGQCLCAPSGSMLVIDEPELHLHRALMDKLWNKVEELCPDKSIVYITHDLDFAASRSGAKKIWVESYSGKEWVWNDTPTDEALPEALVLEIIGNRKPLLFCEGDRGSLDYTIYQLCFPDLHVIPRGGSREVIETTKALRNNVALHTFSAYGIFDRDVLSQSEIDAYAKNEIHALEFAEVENLLCIEELVILVASQESRNPTETVAAVTGHLLKSLNEELEMQVAMRSARRIRYHLSTYSAPTLDEPGLDQGLSNLLDKLDKPKIFSDARKIFQNAIQSKSLNELLKVYNQKSFVDEISQFFGMKEGGYREKVLQLLKGPDGKRFLVPIKDALPKLSKENSE